MTYIETSNDLPMSKVKRTKKAIVKQAPKLRSKAKLGPHKYIPDNASISFRVSRAGKEKVYSIQSGYGYFIPSLRSAGNLVEVAELVESGIQSKDIKSIIEYLNLKIPEIAKAAAVSPSTVSRWQPETLIGAPGSGQFFKIDELIKKGVDLFGGLEEFRGWLNMPNIAIGNQVPANLVTSLIGIELLDEAIDALHYGNVM